MIPVYLIISVFFSYLVTLGDVTSLWHWTRQGFARTRLGRTGRSLFTILIAVGETTTSS